MTIPELKKLEETFHYLLESNGMEDISARFKKHEAYEEFVSAPASTKYHGSYSGGLLEHSVSVARHLVSITHGMSLRWQNTRSPVLVGLFHDFCKHDSYVRDKKSVGEEPLYKHNERVDLTGHGEKSVMMLSTLTELTMEEVMCIRYHMGAFTDKTEWAAYSRACSNFRNVLWTHTADMLASQVEGI